MKNVLALDLGTRTGWALRRADGSYSGGTYNFSGASSRVGQRYWNFRRFLIRVVRELYPETLKAVIYEQVQFAPRAGGIKAAQSWAGFEATLTCFCEAGNIQYTGVSVGTLKKDATGNGQAAKDDMVAAARALGWRVQDDNHADAIHLMQYYEVHHEHRPRRQPDFEKAEAEALEL